jgi:hypothetical protein
MTEWINERDAEMRHIIAAVEELEVQLSQAQRCWRPNEAEWSIAQVLEHLILTDGPSLEPISRVLYNAPRADCRWKPTLMGRLITKAVEPRTQWKTKAKKGFLPTAQPRAGVAREYVEVRKRFLELLDRSRGVNLNRVKTNYPIRTPISYNLGDAFMILTRHTQRHLQQIDRIRRHPEFPRSESVRA